MNIPWEEQPTPEHVWIESYSAEGGGWHALEDKRHYDSEGEYWRASDEDDYYEVHRRPEQEFKQGDLVDVIYDDDVLNFYGAIFISEHKGTYWIKYENVDLFAEDCVIRKHETERDRFIRLATNVSAPAISETQANLLWEWSFRYTGDKE